MEKKQTQIMLIMPVWESWCNSGRVPTNTD